MTPPGKRPRKTPYTKPPLSLQDQLQQLKDRGMHVLDDGSALHYLAQLNYYRLGAYWLPFERDHAQHIFHENAKFDEVINHYVFDRELRLLLMDAIERIEVSIRTKLAYTLSHKYGTHPHLKPELFFNPITYGRSISKLENEVRRSGEEFIKHLTKTYEELLPPIWAVVELMTMGSLSTWYGNLRQRSDRKAIADDYALDEKYLRSFLHHLTTVRNLCAHHSRVWNREYTFTPKLPGKSSAALTSGFHHDGKMVRKIYNSLVLLARMMDIISPDHHWKIHLKELIDRHQINPQAMGFPVNWQTREIWK